MVAGVSDFLADVSPDSWNALEKNLLEFEKPDNLWSGVGLGWTVKR